MRVIPERVAERIRANAEAPEAELWRIQPNGCWNWALSLRKGTRRGQLGWVDNGKVIMNLAHRVVYTVLKGEIPEGLHIDHTCRNSQCVNPTHLEAVTPLENMRRHYLTPNNGDSQPIPTTYR